VRLVVVLALVAVPTALATHPSQHVETKANLDRDRAMERVVGVEDVSSDHSTWRASVRVVDRCRGRDRTHFVVRGYQRLESASSVQADGRGPSEVVGVVLGLQPDAGVARVVRFAARRSRCPTLRTLFRYVARDTSPPARDLRLIRFRVEMHDLETSYPGRELTLFEDFQMPPMLSTVVRVTQYRYVRRGDRYVAYATRTHRVP
jgi:hypothetical protein